MSHNTTGYVALAQANESLSRDWPPIYFGGKGFYSSPRFLSFTKTLPFVRIPEVLLDPQPECLEAMRQRPGEIKLNRSDRNPTLHQHCFARVRREPESTSPKASSMAYP